MYLKKVLHRIWYRVPLRERKDGTWFTTGMKDASKLEKNFWNQANDQSKVSINLLRESDVRIYELGDDVILVIKISG